MKILQLNVIDCNARLCVLAGQQAKLKGLIQQNSDVIFGSSFVKRLHKTGGWSQGRH